MNCVKGKTLMTLAHSYPHRQSLLKPTLHSAWAINIAICALRNRLCFPMVDKGQYIWLNESKKSDIRIKFSMVK